MASLSGFLLFFSICTVFSLWITSSILSSSRFIASNGHQTDISVSAAGAAQHLSRNTLGPLLLPEEVATSYWLRRTGQLPYRSWYHYDDATSTSPASAPHLIHRGVVERSMMILPCHAIYLFFSNSISCVLSAVEEGESIRAALHHCIVTADRHPEPIQAAGDGEITAAGLSMQQRYGLAAMALGCIAAIGIPAIWSFSSVVVRLLRCAAKDRAEIYTSDAADPSADAAGETGVTEGVVAAAIFSVAMVPLLVLELYTTIPYCFCGSVMIWCFCFIVEDEVEQHSSIRRWRGEDRLPAVEYEDFDLSCSVDASVVGYHFFRLKQLPSKMPLVKIGTLVALLALTHTQCLYFIPLLLLWCLTSCFQRCYVRILICSSDVVPTKTGMRYKPIAFSCHRDWMQLNHCFCALSVAAVMVVLGVTTPLWWSEQPLLTFMDLFAPTPLYISSRGSSNTTGATQMAAGESVHAVSCQATEKALESFTGAAELHLDCLTGAHPSSSCARPTANFWMVTETLGIPWSAAARTISALLSSDEAQIDREGVLWLNYLIVLTLAGSLLIPFLCLLLYRLRRPLLHFDRPVQYAAAKQQHFAAEIAAGTSAQRRGARHGGSAAAAGTQEKKPRGATLSSLSREEHVVKQVVLLLWMTTACIMSGAVLLRRSGPGGVTLLLVPMGLLSGIYYGMARLRRQHPAAFLAAAVTKGSAGAAASSVLQEGPQQGEAPASHGIADAPQATSKSFWASSPDAPSLAFTMDAPWLCLSAAIVLLSTGAMTVIDVAVLIRYVLLLLLGSGAFLCIATQPKLPRGSGESLMLISVGVATAASFIWVGTHVGALYYRRPGISMASPSIFAAATMQSGSRVYAEGRSDAEQLFKVLQLECAAAVVMSGISLFYALVRVAELSMSQEEAWFRPG